LSKYDPYLKYFDNYQEVYLREEGFFDPIAEVIVNYLDVSTGISILDVGCGHGDFLSAFHKILGSKAFYFGITTAQHEIEHMVTAYPFINPILGNQQNIAKLVNGQIFDLVINFHTLSYLRQKDQLSVVNQMLNILTPRGLLLLSLIDHWTKFSSNIIQAGEGYIQFAYNPLIYPTVEKCSTKLYAETTKPDGYRVILYRKERNQIPFKAVLKVIAFVIMNNLCHLHFFKKIAHRIVRGLPGGN
tara:strand:- start:1867 stop:2598 length:732 start_codon:yes stop_codon:yes gene_type:complete